MLLSATPLAAGLNASRNETVTVVRLHPTTQRLAALIEEATARSSTFRNMVASIEATDGMVFIDEGRCSRGVPACLIWQLTQAGRYRVLFVVIDTRRPDIHLMASIGHELRHALEVLEDPAVRTTAAIKRLYMRQLAVGSNIVETAAATAAGEDVLREIHQSRKVYPHWP
jgi:hypothetical protein